MPAPDYFIKSLIRIALLKGRSVLEEIVTGQFRVIAEGGGKILSGSSVGGHSFSFQVPPSMTTDAIMAKAEEALEWFDSTPREQIEAMLSTRPITKLRARF